jgi:hypothetical protein
MSSLWSSSRLSTVKPTPNRAMGRSQSVADYETYLKIAWANVLGSSDLSIGV